MNRDTRAIQTALIILAVILVLWFGYAWIADYGDGVASGTYRATSANMGMTITLRSDHTFHQTRIDGLVRTEADGTWREFGEAGLVFTGMLPLPCQTLADNGDAYGGLYKTLGVWPPFISVNSSTICPIYRKRFFAFG